MKRPSLFETDRLTLPDALDIQERVNTAAWCYGRPSVALVNGEEERRIHELIDAETWPQGWAGDELRGDVATDRVLGEGTVQPLMAGLR